MVRKPWGEGLLSIAAVVAAGAAGTVGRCPGRVRSLEPAFAFAALSLDTGDAVWALVRAAGTSTPRAAVPPVFYCGDACDDGAAAFSVAVASVAAFGADVASAHPRGVGSGQGLVVRVATACVYD